MPTLVDDLLTAFGLPDARPDLLGMHGLGALGDSPEAHRRRRRLRLTNAVLREELRRIDQGFDDLPYLLLKGQPLEEILFEDRARLTGDIDLLVVPGDLEAAQTRLEDLGYRPKRDEPPRMWFHNQQPWVHQRHSVVVELHWSTTHRGVPALPLADLFETRVPFEFDETLTVDVLRRDWLVLHLAQHFHHHMGFAKGLLDIAAWCDRFGADIDGEELASRARRLGLYGMLQWPLHTLARLTDRRPPLLGDDIDEPVRLWARASSRAMQGCLSRPHKTDLEATLACIMPRIGPWRSVPLQAASMLTLDGWPARLRGLVHPVAFGPHRLGKALYQLLR